MMSAAATDIIVEIINKIIDNIDKTVDDNKQNHFQIYISSSGYSGEPLRSCCDLIESLGEFLQEF